MANNFKIPSQQMTGTQTTGRHRLLGRFRMRGLMGIIMVSALIAAACGGALRISEGPEPASTPPDVTPPPAVESQTNQTTNALVTNLPFDFGLSSYQGEDVLGGSEIDFSNLFGTGRPVVLNFWAAFCPPCRAEMPDIQSVYHQFQRNVNFFGLDIGPFVGLGSRDDGKELIQKLGVTYPTGTTFDAQVVRAYQVRGMPTTLFLTPDGEVFNTWTGALNREKLEELIKELLEASGERM